MAHRAFILPRFEKKMSTVDECVEIVGGNELRIEPRAFAGIEVLLIARPAGSDTGGDVYCVHSCGHGTLAKFVLLDLTGHGAEHNAIARSLHEVLHQYSEETSPARLLELVNRQYNPPSAPVILATAVGAVFDPIQGVFRFSNAGQPRPLYWSATLRQWFILLETQRSDRGLPLGVLDTACYDEETVALSPVDIFLLSSDALSETRNAAGEFLEPEGAVRLLQEATQELPDNFSLGSLAQEFLRRVEQFRGEPGFDDDLTMLWLQRLPNTDSGS